MNRLLFFLLFIPSAVFGQITIDQTDMPMPGDVFTFSIANDLNWDIGPSGANQNWNFSGLQSASQGSDDYVTVESTPFLYQFFFNNELLYPEYKADVAMAGEDINVVIVSATELFNYYKTDEAGHRLVGIGANVQGLPTSTVYDPIDWIYEFPMNYNDEFDGESFIEFSLPNLGYISQAKTVSTIVDGWGQLSLPIGNYEVLRLKRTIAETDSIYNDMLGQGFSVDQPLRTNFQWLAEGVGSPVLEMDIVNDQVINIKYADDLLVGIESFEKKAFGLYPNPSKDFIQLTTDSKIDQRDLQVVDGTGRVVACPIEINQQGAWINVSDLDQGLYHLQISSEIGIQSKPFIIRPA